MSELRLANIFAPMVRLVRVHILPKTSLKGLACQGESVLWQQTYVGDNPIVVRSRLFVLGMCWNVSWIFFFFFSHKNLSFRVFPLKSFNFAIAVFLCVFVLFC